MLIQRQRSRFVLTAALLAATVAIATGCASAAPPSDGPSQSGSVKTVAIKAGVAASQSSAALLLGVKQGFFKDEGIDVTTDFSATGAGGIPQLINGQLQTVLGGISGSIAAASEGIGIAIVSGSVNDREDPAGTQYQTIVSPNSSIKSFADLSGKTIAVNSLLCCWDFWVREAVEKDGGDSSSLKLVQLSFPDAVTALQQGNVDAISTVQPFATQLRQEGFRDIGDSPAAAYDDPNNGNTVFTMSRQFIDQNPGIVERWQKALQKSSDYANDHPDETRAQIIEQTKADPELVNKAPLPLYSAKIDRNAVEREAGFLVKYGVIKKAPSLDSLIAP